MAKQPYTKIANSEILETKEYDVFVIDIRNRPIHDEKVNAFIKQFKKGNYFMKEFPAIVDENFTILDGQHRLKAAQNLSLPFYFRFTDSLSFKNIVDVQVNAGWSTMDYVHAYIKQNKNDYVVLHRFMKRYKMPATTAAHLLTNNMKNSLISQGFYEGSFKVFNEAKAHEYAKTIQEIQSLTDNKVTSKGFCMSVAIAMQVTGFNKKRLIDQMKKYGTLLKHQVSIKEFLRNLEEIYNYRATEKNRLRLL